MNKHLTLLLFLGMALGRTTVAIFDFENNGYHIWFNFSHEGKNTNQLIWNFFSKHSL